VNHITEVFLAYKFLLKIRLRNRWAAAAAIKAFIMSKGMKGSTARGIDS